ncbi:MAG: O-antigen polymerase [Nitrosopumilaceae archaeon]|nr:O-antigen polymerase [Nitrosopumilaceae archaeon]
MSRKRMRPLSNQADFLTFLYVLVCILGFFQLMIFPELSTFDVAFSSMLYFSICLIFLFLPVFSMKKTSFKGLMLPKNDLFSIFIFILIIGGMYSIVYFSYDAVEVLRGDIRETRNNIYIGEYQALDGSIFSTIAVGFASFYSTMHFLAFLVLRLRIFGKNTNRVSMLMFFSTFGYVTNVLAYAGRDGVIYWIMSIIFNYLLVKSLFGYSLPRKLKMLFICALLVLVIPFIAITVSRFGNESFFYVFYYLSQQLPLFNDYFILDAPLYSGSRNFSEILNLFSQGEFNYERQFHYIYINNGIMPWGFATLIGSFYMDFGSFGTLPFCGLIGTSVLILLKRNIGLGALISFDFLFLYILHAQILFMGIFYFRYALSNNYLMVHILLYVVFFLLRKNGMFKVYRV